MDHNISSNIEVYDSLYCWDGHYKGEEVNSGVFVWIADITFMDGKNAILTGDVTVIK